MNTNKHRLKNEIRKSVFTFAICFFIYVFSYGLNSFLGGYWLAPEMDGHDRLNGFWALHTAIIWQSRFGHEALGDLDFLGVLYTPLIRLDRKYIHQTMYLSDETFKKITDLKISQIHPHWRDEFLTKIKVTAVEDETNKVLRCVFNYQGSDHPREIVEIKMKRTLANALTVSAPNGFIENTNEGIDQFFKTNYVYWVGRLPLEKGQSAILQFPIQNFKGSTGSIVFYYQRTDNSVDSRNICSVELK